MQNTPIKPVNPPAAAPTTQKTVSTPDFRSDIVKTYQEAGQVGVLLLTIVIITMTSSWVILRALKMYASLSEKQLQLSETRVSAFEKMSLSIAELSSRILTLESKVDSFIQLANPTSTGSDRQRRPSKSRRRDPGMEQA